MSYKIAGVALGCLLSFSAMAENTSELHLMSDKCHPWTVIGSMGYTWYNDMYDGGSGSDPDAQTAIGDGKTAMARFAIAKQIYTYEGFDFGAELGVQSGNTFRFDIPQTTIDPLGGILPQATIKPMLDLLATFAYQPSAKVPVFGLFKLGLAYQRMQINDRVTFNDISQTSPEIQAGFGMDISKQAKLSLVYQGVFNGGTTYTVNTVTSTGHVSNIPSQNGLLLSLSYSV